MTALSRRPLRRGIAAIELALILVLGMGLLPLVLVFGNVFWQYSVLQKALHASTRYMASLPELDMMDTARLASAKNLARTMVADATAAGGMRPPLTIDEVGLSCDGVGCAGGILPATVSMGAAITLPLDWFFLLTRGWVPPNSTIGLVINVTMRYGS